MLYCCQYVQNNKFCLSNENITGRALFTLLGMSYVIWSLELFLYYYPFICKMYDNSCLVLMQFTYTTFCTMLRYKKADCDLKQNIKFEKEEHQKGTPWLKGYRHLIARSRI